jgi:hypothetical protein
MNPSPFSARQVLPGSGQLLRGYRIPLRFGVEFVRGHEGALAGDEPSAMVPAGSSATAALADAAGIRETPPPEVGENSSMSEDIPDVPRNPPPPAHHEEPPPEPRRGSMVLGFLRAL